MKSKSLIFILSALAILLFASRMLPHNANWGPAFAICIFSGFLAKGRGIGFLLPVLAWFGSDWILGFYPSLPFQYLSLLVCVAVGYMLKKSAPAVAQNSSKEGLIGYYGAMAGSGLVGAACFFLISNFGVWMMDGMYAPTFDGLMMSYTMGLPFFKATFVSTMSWMVVFAGLNHVAQNFSSEVLSQRA